MKYLSYVLKHLKRNWIRTASTLAGLVLCIFLICVLQTVLDAIRQTTADADPSRIITRHAVSVNFRLPLSYKPRIQAIPGVRNVAIWTWFGGVYRDIKDFFPNFAVESEDYFRMYPEYRIPPDQYQEYLHDMQGLVIGTDVAAKYRFTIGDQIQMESIQPLYRARGPLKFNVRAIYTADPAQVSRVNLGMAFFHFKYLYETIKDSAGDYTGAGTFNIQIANPSQAPAVMRAIDANFENSDVQTKTETEGAFLAGFINLIGNLTSLLNAVGMAVAFTILLVSANTMSMAIRERRTEIAVLKALGFSAGLVMRLVIVEALALGVIGALVGIGLAQVTVGYTAQLPFMGFFLGNISGLSVSPLVAAITFSIGVGLGAAAGFVPAVGAYRAPITDMLRPA
jgi:putative ABC transport system permease protein